MRALRLAAPLSGLDNWDICRAEEMILGYCAKWVEQDKDRVTLGVEKRFQLQLHDGNTMVAGSLDALIREHDSRVRLIEHKTSSKDISPGSPYWANVIAADSQISTYMQALKGMGYEATDCVYDVLRKITLLPYKATPMGDRKYTKATKNTTSRLYADQRVTDETLEEYRLRIREDIASQPQHYYVRQTVVRLDSDDEKHEDDVRGTVEMINYSRERMIYPRHPASCQRYNTMCPYHGVCSGIDNINNERSFRTARTAHEELVDG